MICVESVRVYPSSATLEVGTWYYELSSEVCPTNATCKSVRWHSDNTNVATVNASSGYIYAKEEGTARIYATAIDGSGKRGYIDVTVRKTVKISSISLSRPSLLLEQCESYCLWPTVYPESATNKSLNWSSSNTNVATVSNGLVNAISKGSATITATAADESGKCACCYVTVTDDILVKSITVSPSSKTMEIGGSVYLRATVCPTNATNKSVTWSSNNTIVATVNSNSGLVYAKNEGTATIYATAKDGRGVKGTCSISVGTPPVDYFIWHYLMDNFSVTEVQAAAIMGNMYAESKLNPMNAEDTKGYPGVSNPEYIEVYDPNDNIAWGLIQWKDSRRKKPLLEFATKEKLGDLVTQLEFLLYEVTDAYGGYYKQFFDQFKEITDLNEATDYFCAKIEGKGEGVATRRDYAREYLEKFSSN